MSWRVNKPREEPITCSLLKSPTVFIEPAPRHKIELLMSKYPNMEWLGYLVGRVSEKKNYFVEDISIPPHKEVSSASAEAEPFHIPDRCIGIIHSHNGMGAFHSGTDQDYVDKNFEVSVTVAKSGGVLSFDTVSYQTTSCGKGVTLKSEVKYVQPDPQFDTEAFMKEATENIDKGKRIYTPRTQVGQEYTIYPEHSLAEETHLTFRQHRARSKGKLPYSGHRDYVVDENGYAIPQGKKED